MTWEVLALSLRDTLDDVDLLTADPAGTLAQLEQLARSDAANRRWDRSLLALQDAVEARGEPLPKDFPYAVDRLVRWDGFSRTLLGHEPGTGFPVVVRLLREGRRADPLAHRLFQRQTAGLVDRVSGLVRRQDWCAAPLPGDALAGDRGAPATVLARLLATGLDALVQWQREGLRPVYTPDQWRETGEGLVLVALDETSERDGSRDIEWLAGTLAGRSGSRPDDPIWTLANGLAQAAPPDAREAVESLVDTMASCLTAARHELYLRSRTLRESDRLTALSTVLDRLEQAVAPPTGIGAVGVDLQGQVLAVRSNTHVVSWGPMDNLTPLWTSTGGFDAPRARQFLRARARSPSNPRLQTEVGGDASVTHAVGRWVSAGLKLRTLRILLRHQLDGVRAKGT